MLLEVIEITTHFMNILLGKCEQEKSYNPVFLSLFVASTANSHRIILYRQSFSFEVRRINFIKIINLIFVLILF